MIIGLVSGLVFITVVMVGAQLAYKEIYYRSITFCIETNLRHFAT